MKIFVLTEAKPLMPEEYVGVKKSLKEAIKAFRQFYPHMRETGSNRSTVKTYASDANCTKLLFIHEEEL